MSITSGLAEEYCRLTGRPMAGLTVKEYVMLRQQAVSEEQAGLLSYTEKSSNADPSVNIRPVSDFKPALTVPAKNTETRNGDTESSNTDTDIPDPPFADTGKRKKAAESKKADEWKPPVQSQSNSRLAMMQKVQG